MDTPTAATAALFLDRDGVINIDRGYVHRVDQFEFTTGIFDLARFAIHSLNWHVIVITNQSGIGRGCFDEATYQDLTGWMCERFREEGAPIARVYHCPFHPEHGVGHYRIDHDWRKPKPGMILQAAADFALNLGKSAMIGDHISDMEAGAAAGIQLLLRLEIGNAHVHDATPPHIVIRSLGEASDILRKHRTIQASIRN